MGKKQKENKNEEELKNKKNAQTKEQESNNVNDESKNSNNDSKEAKDSSSIEELKKENQELKDAIKEKENEYLRSYAELENTKKRFEREKYQAIDYASEKFATDLLAVIDTLQMALNHTDTSDGADSKQVLQNLKEGIDLTIKNFNSVFEKHDISEVEYDTFNPELHQAIAQEASDKHEDNDILEVLQKGYMLKDRLLRPAMVKVCKN